MCACAEEVVVKVFFAPKQLRFEVSIISPRMTRNEKGVEQNRAKQSKTGEKTSLFLVFWSVLEY